MKKSLLDIRLLVLSGFLTLTVLASCSVQPSNQSSGNNSGGGGGGGSGGSIIGEWYGSWSSQWEDNTFNNDNSFYCYGYSSTGYTITGTYSFKGNTLTITSQTVNGSTSIKTVAYQASISSDKLALTYNGNESDYYKVSYIVSNTTNILSTNTIFSAYNTTNTNIRLYISNWVATNLAQIVSVQSVTNRLIHGSMSIGSTTKSYYVTNILSSQVYCTNSYTRALVTTFAGSGSTGSTDGFRTNASFCFPCGVAIDSSGNVYVADTENNKIRKIDTSGNVSTLAGSSTSGDFNHPCGVAIDSSGNLYVANTYNSQIREINISGNITTIASSTTFDYPYGIAVDLSGNVYVADTGNNKICKIDKSGTVSTFAGFNNPHGVAVDSSGNVYVADTGNNKICKIDKSGNITTLAGSGSKGSTDSNGTSASFNQPYGVAVDSSGNIYVADNYNNKIRKIDTSGNVTTLVANLFNYLTGVVIDSSDNIFAVDSYNNIIYKIAQ